MMNTIFDYHWSRLVLSMNVGLRFRVKNARVLTADFGHELTYGFGSNIVLWRNHIDLALEIFGRTPLNEPFVDPDSTTLEFHAGPRIWILDELALQVGAGAGLVQGYGAPRFRFSVGLAWSPRHTDVDQDGVLDVTDACPLEPEDRDGTDDSDGCPELDNDNDGILDAADACPDRPEDRNGVKDDDGCPDRDRDADGIADAFDQCPLDAEDTDGVEDDDGCPDRDHDRDGIADIRDKCPNEPEQYNGVNDQDGCPNDATLHVISAAAQPAATSRSSLCERSWPDIRFLKDQAQLTVDAKTQLKSLAQALIRSSDIPIEKVWVSGHASSEGTDKYNYQLSIARAKGVRDYLLRQDVPKGLLVLRALGESAPAIDRPISTGHPENRRVSFEFALGGRCSR